MSSSFGATGITNNSELNIDIGNNLIINTGHIVNGVYDTSAILNTNSVAILMDPRADDYSAETNIKANTVTFNVYGSAFYYDPTKDAGDGTSGIA